MKNLSRVVVRLALCAVSFAVAAGALAQSYGLGDQVLMLGHAAFRARDSGTQFGLGGDGYLYAPSGAEYVASLVLPEGAMVTQMCIYANVTDASQNVSVALDTSRLLAGGQSGQQWGSYENANDDVPIGYGVVCSDFAYAFHDYEQGYNVAHDLYVDAHGTSGFGGIRLTWHCQVSLPPASATFADVQPGDFGYQQIEALVASGITGGCGGGNFCPNNTVTRAQMAIFFAKALGLHWPYPGGF